MRTLQAAEFTGCASAGNKTPLLALHGPGAAHNYLLTMQALAEDRATIFYDQLGCGKAARRR
jgi:proline iminopeptidase